MRLGGVQTWHVNVVSRSITVTANITYINIIRKFFVHQRNLDSFYFGKIMESKCSDLPVSISIEPICWPGGKIHP